MPCPCGTNQPYGQCCGRWHAGEAAPTPEALMRSRYAAFVRHDAPYLLRTWHASTRPPGIEFDPHLHWLGLTVKSGQTQGHHATVEFIARYRVGGGSAARMHERSRFVREQDGWFYVEGEQLS